MRRLFGVAVAAVPLLFLLGCPSDGAKTAEKTAGAKTKTEAKTKTKTKTVAKKTSEAPDKTGDATATLAVSGMA